MKKLVLICFLVLVTSMQGTAFAEVEWSLTKELKLNAAPLDIAQSSDGQMVFILTPGAVLVYSAREDKLTEKIPVDKGFDRMAYSEKNNSLMMTSSSEKTLKIIRLDIKQKIDVSGLPFKGPENAPVTIAVFSDYQ
jgi:cellobiose-specific phosphotransferase system component IIB